MNQFGLGVQDALDWIGRLHDDLLDRFLDDYQNLPTFPEESETVNYEIAEYADALGNWVRANDQWSFEVCLFSLSSS
jgi:Delta6-protoilludene synthase